MVPTLPYQYDELAQCARALESGKGKQWMVFDKGKLTVKSGWFYPSKGCLGDRQMDICDDLQLYLGLLSVSHAAQRFTMPSLARRGICWMRSQAEAFGHEALSSGLDDLLEFDTQLRLEVSWDDSAIRRALSEVEQQVANSRPTSKEPEVWLTDRLHRLFSRTVPPTSRAEIEKEEREQYAKRFSEQTWGAVPTAALDQWIEAQQRGKALDALTPRYRAVCAAERALYQSAA